jgi:hypothetical protein
MKSTKICNICGSEKEFNEFHSRKDSKDGLRNECKSCTRNRINKYRKKNKEKTNSWNRETYYRNIEKHKQTKKNYRDRTKEEQKKRAKKYREHNKEKIKNYTKNRKKHDIAFKLRCNVRSRIKNFLKSKNITKNNRTFQIVGCDPVKLKEHIENQFRDGMTWENYGLNGWHIDHIIPLKNAKTENEIFELCHFTNLQPLWWYENLEKRYIENGTELLKNL